MIVTCPQCDTSFFMPDELYKAGRKARCSQCSAVFRLPEILTLEDGIAAAVPSVAQPMPAPEPPSDLPRKTGGRSRLRTFMLALIVFICLAGLGFGGMLIYSALTGDATHTGSDSQSGESEADRQKRLALEARVASIALEDVRQFIVENDSMKRIVVIQGTAVNKFPTPKEFIRVEAQLLDAEKKVLATAQQLCGTGLTSFQLKVLTQKEMQEALNNKIAILTNNVDLPEGGKVPFMIVFPTLPPDLKSFVVRVMDAQDSKGQ